MATLIACTDGNLTDAATWALVNSTSFLNLQNAAVAISTTILRSSTFTPGAITIDGIAVKLALRAVTPAGTFTVRLDQGTTAVAGTTVTVDVADLPAVTISSNATNDGGWQFFKFSAPVTLAAATAYSVAVVCSNTGSQVTLYRDATTNNWSRMLRTTTTQAPVAGDDMVITGEKTGAGTMTTRTVTMNQTAATDYGNNTTGSNGQVTPALAITHGGTLTVGTGAATNYLLRLSGHLIVFRDGTLKVGESGAEIPRGSSAWIEFDCAADSDFGLNTRVGSTYKHHGLSRTVGKDVWYCRLNTDEAIASTSLGVDTDTGWLDNDVIVIASTTANRAQCERGALNGAAGASTLTVDGFAGAGGGLAFAHSGTGDVRAEIILQTRNTGVRAVTSTLATFVAIRGAYSLSWAEFYYCGASSQNGLDIQSSETGAIVAISVHDCEGLGLAFGGTSDNFTLDGFCAYNNNTHFSVGGNVGSNITVENMICLNHTSSVSGVGISNNGGTYDNIIVVGALLYGISINGRPVGSVTNLEVRAGGRGIQLQNGHYEGCTLANFVVRRNGQGLDGAMYSGFIDTITAIGNSTTGLDVNYHFRAKDVIVTGESGFPSQYGVQTSQGGVIQIDGGSFGSLAAHTNGGVFQGNGGSARIVLNNMDNADSNVVANRQNWSVSATVGFTRMNQTDDSHITYMLAGTIEADSVVYETAAPSEKLTPSLASIKLQSSSRLIAVNATDTPTINVYVRKDASYNGNAPRLILLANAAIGVDVDVVLATHSAGAGSWQTLSSVLPAALSDGAYEVCIDCDGTAGTINIDNWSVS